MLEELFSACERALRACEAAGAEEAEVFALARSTTEARFELRDGEPHVFGYGTSRAGLAVRTYRAGRLGFSYTTDLSERALEEVAKSSLRAARPAEGFKGFPCPGKVPGHGIFDRTIAELTEEDVISMLRNLVSLGETGNVRVSAAHAGVSVVHFAVVNSHGLEASDAGTFVGASISTLAEGSPERVPANALRRRLSELDLARLAEESSSLSLAFARVEDARPGKSDVLLSPWVAAELLAYAFADALRADKVRLGTSILKDRLGQPIASEVVSFYDDPLHPSGLCTFGMDDEGWPAERKVLVESGVLKGFLYDSLEAARQGLEGGGNCIRWEPPTVDTFYPRDYRFRPGIYPANLLLAPGTKEAEELMAELGDGIYAHRSTSGFGMTPSGDFSLFITNAFRVRDGEITGGLRELSLKGNVFDLLKHVEAVSSGVEPLLPSMAGFCTLMPYVLVRGVEVAA